MKYRVQTKPSTVLLVEDREINVDLLFYFAKLSFLYVMLQSGFDSAPPAEEPMFSCKLRVWRDPLDSIRKCNDLSKALYDSHSSCLATSKLTRLVGTSVTLQSVVGVCSKGCFLLLPSLTIPLYPLLDVKDIQVRINSGNLG